MERQDTENVVQGEAGRVMAGKLLQDVLSNLFRAFSANNTISKLPEGSASGARREAHTVPTSAPPSAPSQAADATQPGAKRKHSEMSDRPVAHEPERSASKSLLDTKQAGFFGPISDSKIDKDRLSKASKEPSKMASASRPAKRPKEAAQAGKADNSIMQKKMDKIERAIKLVFGRLKTFDRNDLQVCGHIGPGKEMPHLAAG
eukprot:scaffold268119_cov32-Prasinocladus_malaysianus.AAC.1